MEDKKLNFVISMEPDEFLTLIKDTDSDYKIAKLLFKIMNKKKKFFKEVVSGIVDILYDGGKNHCGINEFVAEVGRLADWETSDHKINIKLSARDCLRLGFILDFVLENFDLYKKHGDYDDEYATHLKTRIIELTQLFSAKECIAIANGEIAEKRKKRTGI